ncbi:MAG: Rne/Rng family ribonuclease [Edaphobacter sp.]
MSKEIYISSTPHETRLAIVENDALTEIYYERENEYTLAGSIYNGKVTRVLPGMQSSFVDIGLERDAFLYITDFMEEAGDSADFDTNGNGDSNRRRSDRNSPPTLEGSVAPSDQSSDAGDRNGRSDRGRGGRSRRDRGGNRDRQPNADTLVSSSANDTFNAPAADYLAEEERTENIPSNSDDAEEIGEGAPGADGSRRWRGRRGRRRGRGPGQRDESTRTAGETTSETSNEPSYGDDSFNMEGAAEPTSSTAPVASMYSAPVTTSSPQETRGSSDRNNRGDRNDRNNRGGRDRNRGGRDDRGGRDSRTPRGFAPRTSLYGVEETPAYTEPEPGAASAEPIVLPGESLSKYRKESDAPATVATPSQPSSQNVIVPSAPGFTIPSGWDGGNVLPGESLSRHRRQDNPSQNYRNSPEPTAVAEPVIQRPTEPAPEPTVFAQPEIEAAHLPPSPPPTPVEYEPIDASASYRVDPAAPSEFRQSAPVLDAPERHEEELREEVHEQTYEQPRALIHEEHDHSATHSITPSPAEHVAQLHTDSTFEKFDWQTPPTEIPTFVEQSASLAHELTTLHATGDITSEAPATTFIPDAGALVEETLDEEDYNTTLHASAIEEMEDFDEEETLEGAADLGTMLREMSIDHITGSGTGEGPNEEDLDDDFEEEDAIHELTIGDLDEADEEDAEEELDESDTEEDVIHEDFGESSEVLTNSADQPQVSDAAPARDRNRDNDRGRSRRDGRRDGRRDRFGRGDRPRYAGGAGDRERSGGGRGGRSSVQATNLPAISELLKPGQEILVQIAKEPIAKKGARITSHIALPGRFLVFMPTVNHTGVSRKIDSDGERRRLKEILLSEKGEASGGFIVRTAAEGASEEELRNDLRFLLNLWADIKQRSESSKSPALIYHDLNLVERILRDQVTDNFSAIWVDSETDYERILRFLQRFQPSLIRRVKLYTKETPLFEQFGITEEINKALRSKVWLKSGGSIVINQTEALVAIDINTGKFVGKTARLEDTIVKTNLDAIPEIVRQIRLRDLGGIIIIDFIDMDERKNRNRVMAALEEELKNDRAPSKILQFNDFGLVAITRKRVKQSLERTLSTTCNVCVGTGMVKSPVTVCNDIYIEMRKMQKHLDRGDVMLRVNPDVVKQLKAPGTKWLQEMEEMVGKTILVKSDPSLHPEQFDIH